MTTTALLEATQTTPTALWNDSADLEELRESIGFGAVGATCNPVIALSVLKRHPDVWVPRIRELAEEFPTGSEAELGWKAVERLSREAAELLLPAFEQHGGRNGRLSVQTDPRLHRSKDALVAQALAFDRLAPNIIVKIPATRVGIEAMEEVTYRGVSINATVSFTVPQAIAVAGAVERGLARREADGHDVSAMGAVCTIMVGRLDDWLKHTVERDRILVDPGALEWAGVAAFKNAYRVYRERGYRLRLLSAAFRNHMHWSEFQGGDVVVSPPYEWQLRINENDIRLGSRIDEPVPAAHLAALQELPDFRRAYDENGMAVEDFQDYGATRRTLRQFLDATADLEGLVRDVVVPAP
ncbi:transaldolase family protein [Lysobacter korlensis]|uniref:Transaldolase family protein n=1 Tax=Lysobacter korlensis TaxID=553636 RepID=A0ABV6RU53_9GAMM